jgi:hypothetical protein
MEYGAGLAAAHRTVFPNGWPPQGAGTDWVYGPYRWIHWAKVGFEKWWLWRWF